MDPQAHLLLITGERGAGKTTLCLRLSAALRQAGCSVAGLVTRPAGPQALEALDLAREERYLLTVPFDPQRTDRPPLHFQFDNEAMAASARAFLRAFPASVFFLDEIGPLELIYQQGWSNLLPALAGLTYRWGVLVIRPELLAAALPRLPGEVFTLVRVTPERRDLLYTHLLARLKEGL